MSICQLEARRDRVELTESVISLAIVYPKGKSLGVPSTKFVKKRKKVKTLVEGALKKAKLLASALSTATTTKLYLTFDFFLFLYQCRGACSSSESIIVLY